MATLEKPRKNKTKKLKTTTCKAYTNEEEALGIEDEIVFVNKEMLTSSDGSTVKSSAKHNIDKINDFVASTSACRDNILTKECFIASDYKAENLAYADHESSLSAEMSTGTKHEEEENISDNTMTIPSAPLCVDNIKRTAPLNSPKLVKYPQLQRSQYEEVVQALSYAPTKLPTSAFQPSASKLQPLTQEKLRQYYCADLPAVQQFEMEFLMNSLLETYEDEPLYAALKEYYHMQSKLTMNLYDVKKFRNEAEAAQEHIWVQVPITKTFSEKCGDNIQLKETVTYNILQVDGKNLEVAGSALTILFDIISNTYTNNFITTKIIKMRVY